MREDLSGWATRTDEANSTEGTAATSTWLPAECDDPDYGDDVCMCGSEMEGHSVWDGHSPVSMRDYHDSARRDYARAAFGCESLAYEATARGSVDAEAARAALDAASAIAQAAAKAHEDTLDENACRAAALEVRKLARV